MSQGEGEEGKPKVRDLTEVKFSTLEEVRIFLEQLGDGVKYVEQIVSDVGSGTRMILRANQAVIAALSSKSVEDEIEYHKRKIEELEAAKKVQAL